MAQSLVESIQEPTSNDNSISTKEFLRIEKNCDGYKDSDEEIKLIFNEINKLSGANNNNNSILLEDNDDVELILKRAEDIAQETENLLKSSPIAAAASPSHEKQSNVAKIPQIKVTKPDDSKKTEKASKDSREKGLKVVLCPSLFEENLDPKSFGSFSEFVEETALQKVLEVEERLKQQGQAPDVVVGADTMVTLGEEMFGKPTTEAEAFQMLSRLSGRTHTVYTGVVVKTAHKTTKFTEKTNVIFGKLDEAQIKGYIATGEPMDKAGGYGIQGVGGTFVERVEGDYFTVVGLPLYRLCSVLYDLYKDNS